MAQLILTHTTVTWYPTQPRCGGFFLKPVFKTNVRFATTKTNYRLAFTQRLVDRTNARTTYHMICYFYTCQLYYTCVEYTSVENIHLH